MSGFLKPYSSRAAADRARQRSLSARRAGVRTPAVLGQAGPQTLIFERVTPARAPALADLQQVLAALNRVPPDGLHRFDPFLRIRPRLPGAPAPVQALARRLMARDAALHWPACSVIHGDFHPGQVICDAQGLAWLVDLDDLALAPPEADWGNLAAWRATQDPPLPALPLPTAPRMPAADAGLMAHFQDIALLRRALKLAEGGRSRALDRLALGA